MQPLYAPLLGPAIEDVFGESLFGKRMDFSQQNLE
jgi:hypothetical protein